MKIITIIHGSVNTPSLPLRTPIVIFGVREKWKRGKYAYMLAQHRSVFAVTPKCRNFSLHLHLFSMSQKASYEYLDDDSLFLFIPLIYNTSISQSLNNITLDNCTDNCILNSP
uniref:Uncharacterized protein n=1 Tax=Fopius arisanus TaxID=64838 RepID=A0A0C9R902_9HYME